MTEPTNIADAITAAQGRVADCYTSVSNMGGTLPVTQNLANLPTAIESISTGESYPNQTLNTTQIFDSQPTLDIEGTNGYIPLPDYSMTNNLSGCIGTAGTNYLVLEKKFNDFTINGSPSINYTTGEYKATSNSNYISKGVPSIGNKWELRLKVTTPVAGSMNGQGILDLGTVTSDYGYICIALASSGTNIYMKTGNNSNANILPQGSFDVTAETTYWLKIVSDGSSTTSYYSTTGFDSMTQIGTVATATTINSATMKIGRLTGTSGKGYFKGSFDLNECYLKYTAQEGSPLSDVTRYAWLPNSGTVVEKAGWFASGVTDTSSETTYNLFYNNSFVLDTVSEKEGYQKCGTVTVAPHTVYYNVKKSCDWEVSGTPQWVGYYAASGVENHILFDVDESMTAAEFNGSWEIHAKICTSNFSTYKQYIVSNAAGNESYGINLYLDTSKRLCATIANSDASITYTVTGTTVLADYTEYWVKLVKSNGEANVYISTDNATWTAAGTAIVVNDIATDFSVTNGVFAGTINIANRSFRGKGTDIRYVYMKVGDTVKWKLVDYDKPIVYVGL